MSEEQIQKLTDKFNEILTMPMSNAEDIYNVKYEIDSIYALGIQEYARGYSGQRIVESLKELSSILDTHISRLLIDSGEWDPEKDSVRPDFNKEETPTDPTDEGGDKDDNDDKGNNNTNPEPVKKGCKSSIVSSVYVSILSMIVMLTLIIKKQIFIRRKR